MGWERAPLKNDSCWNEVVPRANDIALHAIPVSPPLQCSFFILLEHLLKQLSDQVAGTLLSEPLNTSEHVAAVCFTTA